MGHHYVPQEYLRAFAISADLGMVWTYDKKDHSCKRLPIKKVAQAPNFYDADVEAELAQKLEGPANIILSQLRAGQLITQEQRMHFAIYTATMMKRVPRRRRIAREETLPKALEDTFKNAIDALKPGPSFAERLAELERIREEFRGEPPKEVIDRIESPWPPIKMAQAIASMTWRLTSTAGPQFFVTSDNPAFFFEGLGVGTAQSEISFPLSPRLALLGSHHKGQEMATLYIQARQKLVREVNRRTVASAERLLFADKQQPWLPALMKKSRPYLSRIIW